ncbi:MAG: hypothetical protein UH081_09415, partial [Clostridia bacterium]|nr:hypothetical protein [Clostridia bacterium]
RDDVGIVPYGGKLYTVANNCICRDRLPDGPYEINHKRTVEDACPYGGYIVNITINYNLLLKGKRLPCTDI